MKSKILDIFGSISFYEEFANQRHSAAQILNNDMISFDPKLLYVSLYCDLAENQGGSHNHEHLEIMYMARGECKVHVGDNIYSVKDGDFVIYDSLVYHEEKLSNVENVEMYFMAVANLPIDSLPLEAKEYLQSSPVISAGEISDRISMFFRELTMEMKSHNNYSYLYISNLSNIIIIQLLRLLCNEQSSRLISEDCKKVLDYIDSNYTLDIDLDSLAKYFYISKHYLSHMFKEQVGVSPIKYLILKRLAKAKSLLTDTDYSVSKIAAMVGYQDPIYFSQFFKKIEGISPSMYKKSILADNQQPN